MPTDTELYVERLKAKYPEYAAIGAGNFQLAGEIIAQRFDDKLIQQAIDFKKDKD